MKRTNGADAYIKTKVTTYLNNHEILGSLSLAFSLQSTLGHLAFTDSSIILTAIKPSAKINYKLDRNKLLLFWTFSHF